MKVDLTSRPDILLKANMRLATNQTVASLARPIAPLTVNTSIPRSIETLRQSSFDKYPVVSGSRLVLLLSEADLSGVLLSLPPEEQERHRLMPLSSVLDAILLNKPRPSTLSVDDPISQAFALFDLYPEQSVVGVVDGRGTYYGILSRADLLAGCFRTLAPAKVGGMATPLGVYLTDGVEYGGVGNWALVLAGALMSALFTAALLTGTWIQNFAIGHHVDLYGGAIRLLTPLMPQYAASFVEDIQVLVPLFFMLLLLRVIPVAGYHAAEHQVVHCIERGEPLLPDKVASMPRPHPRCGTNLVAAISLFGVCFSIFAGLWSYSSAIVPAAIVTLLTWRQVGTFFQQYFTTRKASPKQVASGIAAGEDLLRKYRLNTNRTAKMPLRIWRMGIVQMCCGLGLAWAAFWALSFFVPALKPLLQSLN